MERSLSDYGLRVRNRDARIWRGCPGPGGRKPLDSIPCRGARKDAREALSGWAYHGNRESIANSNTPAYCAGARAQACSIL